MPNPPPDTVRDDGEPRRLFVDSGAWIALASRRDQYHAAADALFRRAHAGGIPLVTTNLVLAEVHRGLLFHAGIAAARHVLDTVEASPLVTIAFAAAEHHAAARGWLARFSDQRFSYTDAVSFAVMTSLSCATAMSFDRHFTVAGFTLWQPGGLPHGAHRGGAGSPPARRGR